MLPFDHWLKRWWMLTDYGKLHVSTAHYSALAPDSVEAAVREWRSALDQGSALRVRGSGHGLSGASLPRWGETLVRTGGLDHYRVEARGQLTVGGGAVLWDIRDFVADRGWRLPLYNGGWAGPTLGGFVSAGGLGLRVPPRERRELAPPDASGLVSLSEIYGGFWAQVARLKIIDGCGEVHEILPGNEHFPWMFASMGQFGLILEATLRLLPQPGAADGLPVGSSGRIPVSNPLNRSETDGLPPAHGVDWTYWFTALVPVDEEKAAWGVIGDWSRAHRDVVRPTGGWVGPLLDGSLIGFRYLVRRIGVTPPLLYPRDESFVTLGVMAVCSGIGTDRGEAALTRAERAFVEQVVNHGWALYCQAENLTRSLDFRSYLGPDRWARFCGLKTRFDPNDRINAGDVRQETGRPPLRAARARKMAAAFRRSVGIADPAAPPPPGVSKRQARNEATSPVDVLVIGGGPAGGTLATVCSQNGLDVALYERERGPRYRIGESLLPATPRQLLPLLGIDVASANFVVKPGATFSWGDRPDKPWNLIFGGGDPGPDAPAALNVDRQRFDEILLENAEARGVALHRRHEILSVGDHDPERGRTVEIGVVGTDTHHQVLARYVADASGQMRFKLPALQARTDSKFFRNVAVWGYWDGAGRLAPPLAGNVFFETLGTEHGPAWAWFVPLSDTLTSVGVVAPRGCARMLRGDRRAVLSAWLADCPRTAALLAEARPTAEPPYDEVRLCKDYSNDRFWAPGFVRVGDAACFVDVHLASGVHLATYGGLLAARSIEAVLRGRMTEQLAMDEYESRVRQEYALFYAGVSVLYDMGRPRDHYIGPLRELLRNSNSVFMERDLFPGVTGGLNVERAAPPRLAPEAEAARNVQAMRAFNRLQLLYDGPPRIVTTAELPAVRNTLTVSADGRGWRLPDEGAPGQSAGR